MLTHTDTHAHTNQAATDWMSLIATTRSSTTATVCVAIFNTDDAGEGAAAVVLAMLGLKHNQPTSQKGSNNKTHSKNEQTTSNNDGGAKVCLVVKWASVQLCVVCTQQHPAECWLVVRLVARGIRGRGRRRGPASSLPLCLGRWRDRV